MRKQHIQTYNSIKPLNKGQWDIAFNNLYTETKGNYNGVKSDKARATFLHQP
jgi:hypothetical protein